MRYLVGLLYLALASGLAASPAAQPASLPPALPVLVAALDSTVQIETFYLNTDGGMVDPAKVPSIGGYRIAGPGPIPRVTLAHRLISIVQRASDSECGIAVVRPCIFSPRFAIRFRGHGAPLDLLVSKDCMDFEFVRNNWNSWTWISDGHGGYLKDAEGKPLTVLGRSTSCIADSLLSICRGLFPEEYAPQPYSIREAYEVYAAVLPSAQRWASDKAKCLIIRTETTFYKMCLQPDKDFEELLGPAIADYVSQNRKQWRLVMDFRIDKPYEMISKAGIDSLFGPPSAAWKTFYERYPDSGGWIELSAVGFSADKTIAIVYMGHHYGILGGKGGFHVLQKRGGVWMPLEWKGSSCMWMS